MRLRGSRSEAGFTLLEVLVAFTILSVAVVGVIQGFAQGLRLLRAAGDQQMAVLIADQKAREVVIPVEGRDEGKEGAFAGMRVALAAWRQGEDRAEAHQHVRSIALVLARSMSAAYPYSAPRGLGPTPSLLFGGTATRLEFVTQTAPYPAALPIAFT